MHISTLLLTATTLLTPTLAAPRGHEVASTTATTTYTWNVSKWTFCRGQSAYTYTFTISGATNGAIPAFTATCKGTEKGGYKACDVVPNKNGKPVPDVSANVNIVKDPNDPNDNIPRLFVQTTFTDSEGCRYTSVGKYDATLNCGSKKGRKFRVEVEDSAVC